MALKSEPFIILFLIALICGTFSIFLHGTLKLYGMSKFDDDIFFTFLGSTDILLSAVSKFFWGIVADIYDFRKSYMTLGILYSILGISFSSIN